MSTDRGIKVWRIGGMPDHVHLLCDVAAKMAVADYIKLIKTETSKFLRTNSNFPHWEKWVEGYACTSVDASLRNRRIDYIKGQKIHHQTISFADKYREFLREYGYANTEPILGDVLPDDHKSVFYEHHRASLRYPVTPVTGRGVW